MRQTPLSLALSDDVHHQATLLRTWNQDYSQLKAGRFSGSVAMLQNGPVKLFSERMNRAVYQSGAVPEGRLAFGLLVRAGGHTCICGEEGTPESLMVFSGRSGFEFYSPENFEFFGIEIDKNWSDDVVFQSMARSLERIISRGNRTLVLETRKIRRLKGLLDVVMPGNPTGENLFEWPDRGRSFNHGLIGWMLDLLEDSENEQEDRGVRHWDAIAAIRRLVTESDDCPNSVAELTVRLGLSRRTLQNACQEIMGLSPIQYLRALRLSESRKHLENAVSVTEAATQFGFWHLGYFARDYNAMFGELPSTTLKRVQESAGSG